MPQKSKPSVVYLAEALLGGDVLIVLQEQGEAAPAWGYINLLAHADCSCLERTLEHNAPRRPLSPWGEVLFGLIVEILARTGCDDEQLLAAQRRSLVPLELAVWDGRTIGTPEDLDVMVRGALQL